MAVRAANSPASWGIEPPDPPPDPPWQQVLDEIAGAGYPGTELGPLGYLPSDPQELVGALAERRLGLAAGFIMVPLAVSQPPHSIEAVARETCELIAAGGAAQLIVMDSVSEQRAATAGRSAAASRLDRPAWRRLTDSVRRVAAIAAEEFSLPASFHPHVGTNVEFEDEVERLLGDVGAAELGLCLDTGHFTYAGMDPVAMLRRHAGRIGYLHFKDIDADRLARARTQGLPFYAAVAGGIFRPLGEGCVDFTGVRGEIEALGYEGWVTVEQDRLPDSSSTPLEEAQRSLAFLQRAGIA